MLGLYIGFPPLNQWRFIARDPMWRRKFKYLCLVRCPHRTARVSKLRMKVARSNGTRYQSVAVLYGYRPTLRACSRLVERGRGLRIQSTSKRGERGIRAQPHGFPIWPNLPRGKCGSFQLCLPKLFAEWPDRFHRRNDFYFRLFAGACERLASSCFLPLQS